MGFLDKLVKGLPIIGDVASAWMAHDAQKDANRQNIKLARENRAWEENMANTAYQRKRRDLEAAGYNPMLGVEGMGSATPNINAPTVESTGRQSAEIMKDSVSKLTTLALMKAQVANTAAQARKGNAEAQILEADIPYTSKNASNKATVLEHNAELLASQIAGKRIENMTNEELRPLIIQYQRIKNQAEALGIPERQALAEFYKNIPEAKWLAIIKGIFK